VSYHITGVISAVIFLLTVSGLWSQLDLIRGRKKSFRGGELRQRPTAILSLNQFVSSFLAFFSFLIYGACLRPLNHYLIWPRLIACLLILVLLWEIAADRRDPLSSLALASGGLLLVAVPPMLIFTDSASRLGRSLSQGFVVAVTALLAQGYVHQIAVIRRSGHTGAVSLRMHQFFFLKDASTAVFAATMGLANGWPVMLMSFVSGATKIAIMWHFRWARVSPLARERRAVVAPAFEPAIL